MSGWQPPQNPGQHGHPGLYPAAPGGPGRGGPPHPGRYPGGPPLQRRGPGRAGRVLVIIVIAFAGLMVVGMGAVIAFLGGRFGAEPTPTTSSGPAPSGSLTGTLWGGGASAVTEVMALWESDVTAMHPEFTLIYESTGSVDGRERFIVGDFRYAISDRPLNDDEYASSVCPTHPLNLPIVAAPVALVAQLPGVSSLVLNAATVAAIYRGEITTWNDPRIAELNPGVSLPDIRITAVHHSDQTQTNLVLSEWLAAAGAWDLEPSQTWPTDRGTGVNGTRGVIEQLTAVGAVGYFSGTKAPDGTTVITLRHGGADLLPTGPEASHQIDGSPRVPNRSEHDQSRQLDRTIAGAYPVLEVYYLLVCEQYADAHDAESVRGALGWILSPQAQGAASEQGLLAPLSPQLSDELQRAIGSIR